MNEYTDFITPLRHPAAKYGEVPFYWWSGEPLDKPRLRRQLETLAAAGIAGVQVNYAHAYKGGEEDLPYGGAGRSLPGEPYQFTDEWWDFFGYAARVCEELGISVGVGDYTLAWLGNGFFTDRVAETPGMLARELSAERKMLFGPEDAAGDDLLAVVAYEDAACERPRILYEKGKDLPFPYGCYDAFVLRLRTVPRSLDPLHEDSGRLLTDLYFGEFMRRLPDLKPGTLNYFFQDELLFGADVKRLWRENLREAVEEKYGYDPLGYLPHLFYHLGPLTAKIRLDIADVRTELAERNYFRPVYEFHASRGLIYGCDQSGRGRQPDEFSDYFRTVRWFTAPGNDTPGRAADLIKVKVNASIADLYDRPRVWLEGYHSSGWGTSLASITAPTDDNFLYGANLLNLHGLYYTTNGGFFEWAPPDFHFRMPYWDDEKSWLDTYKRLSAILTTGRHACDAAIFYPVSSFDFGENADACRDETFRTAEYLFDRGVDFCFIDHQSVGAATVENGALTLPNASFRAVILCGADCVRFSVLQKLRAFAEAGGCVLFTGITPYESDLPPARRGELKETLAAILAQPGAALCQTDAETLSALNGRILRRFFPDADDPSAKTYCTSRILDGQTLFFTRYCTKDTVCRFHAVGQPFLLDPERGTVTRLLGTVAANGFTFVKMPLDGERDTLLLFTDDYVPFDGELNTAGFAPDAPDRTVPLDGEWTLTLQPTLDNAWGDFYKPAGGVIGAQARFFTAATPTGAPAYEGELPYCRTCASTRLTGGENVFETCRRYSCPGTVPERGETLPLHDRYGFVLREKNTENACREQGYHGLKGRIHEHNFVFEEDAVLLTDVVCDAPTEAYWILSGVRPDVLYLNGEKIGDEAAPVRLPAGRSRIAAGFIYDRNLCPDYVNRAPLKRAEVRLARTPTPRETGFPLAVNAFGNPDYLRLSPIGGAPETVAFSCVAAPGTYGFTGCFFGELIRAELNGEPLTIEETGTGFFGGRSYRAVGSRHARAPRLTLTVRPDPGLGGTGAIPEPVSLLCGEGLLPCGDAATVGALKNYSGKLVYQKTVRARLYEGERAVLSLGDVGVTARVQINGREAAVLTHPPYACDATAFLTDGDNEVRVTVSNTLCNHYATVPSAYANYPEDAGSGLIGPVSLRIFAPDAGNGCP